MSVGIGITRASGSKRAWIKLGAGSSPRSVQPQATMLTTTSASGRTLFPLLGTKEVLAPLLTASQYVTTTPYESLLTNDSLAVDSVGMDTPRVTPLSRLLDQES